MTRKLIVLGTAVMTTLLALVVLWQFHVVVVYMLVSLALAATIRPLVKRLYGRTLLARIAWIFLYIAALGSVGFLIFLAGKSAIAETQLLGQNLSSQNVWILPKWLEGTAFQHTLVSWLPAPNKLFMAVTGDKGQLVLPALLGFLQNLGGVVTGMIVILFLGIYWSINQIHFERLWLSLLQSGQRKKARGIWRKIEPEIGAYIRSELVFSLATGLILGPGFWLLGSPYPALLAIAGALACLIPLVGAPLTVILVLAIGLLTNIQIAIFTTLFALIVLIALAIWVKPRLMKVIWENHVLTLVLVIALADAFGIIGIIVAPLVSIVCQILWRRLISHPAILGAAVQLSDLQERQKLLWDKINLMPEPRLTLITSSMERLDELITKAQPVLKEADTLEPVVPIKNN